MTGRRRADRRGFRARRSAPFLATFVAVWTCTTVLVAPVALVVTRDRAHWPASIAAAAIVALILTLLGFLADNDPDDSNYDA